MKIGILVTGILSDVMAAKYKDFDAQFKSLLDPYDEGIEWSSFEVVHNQFPESVDQCDAWIVTGSKHGAYEDHAWIPPLEDFIRESVAKSINVIGICFGHQIIAQALGGKVVKSEKGYAIGRHEYKMALPDSLSKLVENSDNKLPNSNQFALNVSHGDQVVDLPESAEIIATSDFCEFAALYYPEGALTFQGHPEFSAEFESDLVESRWEAAQDWIEEARVNEARENMNIKTDRHDVGHLLYEFLKSHKAEKTA